MLNFSGVLIGFPPSLLNHVFESTALVDFSMIGYINLSQMIMFILLINADHEIHIYMVGYASVVSFSLFLFSLCLVNIFQSPANVLRLYNDF